MFHGLWICESLGKPHTLNPVLGTSREPGAFQGRKAFDKIKKNQSKDAPKETKVKEYVSWQRDPKYLCGCEWYAVGFSRRAAGELVGWFGL